MNATRSGVVLLIAILCFAPGGARAQTSADAARSWGLLGTWKQDCGAPAGKDNPAYMYRANGPQIVLDRDFGEAGKDSNMVSGVRVGSSNEISYRVAFGTTDPPQSREHLFVKSSDGRRFRTISNRNPDNNVYSVRDGKFTDDGQNTPWMVRCQ